MKLNEALGATIWLACAVAGCSSDGDPGAPVAHAGQSPGGAAGAPIVLAGAGGGGSSQGGAASSGATGFSGAAANSGAGGSSGSSTGGSGGVAGISGGTGGSAAGGGSAGAPPYAPCPPKGTPCVIMPIGDSITAGYQSSTGGGYRLRLLHDIWTAAHDATFEGDASSGPNTLDGKPFPKHNEGHSAYTIDPAPALNRSGISPLVPLALAMYEPHVVTLMIGTNDLGTNNDVANAPNRLGKLIDSITTGSPNALLIVAQITPTGDDNLNKLVQAYNQAIPGLVQSRVAAGKHIIVVDMYGAFTSHASYRTEYMFDSLHPNDKGYDLMGDIWYAALAPHL